MIGFGVLVGGVALTSAVLLVCYERYVGCTGGHIWSEGEPTDRWKTIPFESSPSLIIQRQFTSHCTRDGCSATKTEIRDVSDEIYADAFAEAVWEAVGSVVHYECPNCHEQVPEDERGTEWRDLRAGKSRYEQCPVCELTFHARYWNRVPREELQ